MGDNEFDTYFARHCRDAVLLHRPYPPHTAPRTNSKFGGLPRLPEHYEWPRDGKGAPLHFLAQIDCADISFETRLPERGVLFFFAREDEEQIWNDDDWIKDASRVIYALDAFAMTPLRAPPDDLGPVGGSYYPRPAWRGLVLKGEEWPKVHVEWPIQPLKIDSWPDTLFEETREELGNWLQRLRGMLGKSPEPGWQEEQARYGAYDDAHRERRLDAFARATGEVPDVAFRDHAEREAARAIFEHEGKSAPAFPFHWINIRHPALYLIWAFEEGGWQARYDEQQIVVARDWLARARAEGDDAVPSEADRAAFREWLMHWHKPNPDVPPDPLRYAEAVHVAMRANIRNWSGNPALAAKIAPYVYDALRGLFAGPDAWGLRYSQMLGHTPSAQEPLRPDDPTLCLLNLISDDALGTMYGDVGNATFYISPGDLARRDFSAVEAEVVGH